MNTISDIATTTEQVVTKVQGAIPYAEGLAALVPGLGSDFVVAMEMAKAGIPVFLKALEAIVKLNGGDLITANTQLLAHIDPDMPNLKELHGKIPAMGATP